jgi:hypothetical protein
VSSPSSTQNPAAIVKLTSSSAWARLAATACIATGLATVAGCASVPDAPPPLVAPPAVVNDDNYVTHVTSRTVNGEPAQVKAWLEQKQLASFFPKDQGIAGVKRTVPLVGVWGTNGSIRRVELDDGHYAFDHVIENVDARMFRYQIYGLTNVAGTVSEYVHARIEYFKASERQTEVKWTYAVRPKSFITKPLVTRFVDNQLKPYMEAAMDNMRDAAIKDFPRR